MNLNVKLDGEEEQPLQYVNRFAFNIPSGATAFNLNIVNPGLSNQSYILNPMNSVGQSIVTYQPPVALQSYIALPTEGEGNIIHGLPVGVPVPVGLPVSTGLLQNNFVNTSIIIGNDDGDSHGVIKSTSNSGNPENEIKINYIEKPAEQLKPNKPNGIDNLSVRVSTSPQAAAEATPKKPCPLEMSIKAANIDEEFEKCESGIPIIVENCQAVMEKRPLLVEQVPLEPDLKSGVLKVPFEIASVEQPASLDVKENKEKKKVKTEITWENNNKQDSVDNSFPESLICEVEEANDDDDEDEDDEEEAEEEEDEEVEEEEDEDEEKESEAEDEVNNYTSANSNEGLVSSEESDSLPLSVAFRLDKVPNSKGSKCQGEENPSPDKMVDGVRCKQKKCQRSGKKGWEELAGGSETEETRKESGDWSESDDDVLNLKRIKSEFDYKCFYEPKAVRMDTSTLIKLDNKSYKFVRVRSCCSKRECGKKITIQDQKAAHRHFYELESNAKREGYLMNCIEYVQKNKQLENIKDKGNNDQLLSKLEEDANIKLEIENESNGNQKLSDEIQKAINESLKDCAANESREEGEKSKEGESGNKVEGTEKTEKNTWNFYIVIDRCRKKVCLQFLLKLFQISKNRIRHLQKKILSGSPLADDSPKSGQKSSSSDVWEVAKLHLKGFESVECGDCKATPRHRFLTEIRTKEDLFNSFRNFHLHKLGKEPNIKYASYKRFLEKKTSLSFCSNQEGICSECEELKRQERRRQSKPDKSSTKTKKGKECKKQWVIKSDSEDHSSDDEPLLKRKKLKLTIPLRSVDGKTAQKRTSKKYSLENRNRGKSKPSGSRGRDVWSLMLLHLETMPYKECKSCVSKKKHRFLDASFTTQGLFEDYRKYFLKETNSELGLGFTMYEKYFNRNCNYMIRDVDVDSSSCPGCTATS